MLTNKPGNPAHEIIATYQELMAITCVETLRKRAMDLVGRGGISARNAAKFRAAVAQAPNVSRLQSYLTNFALAADGMAVVS